MVDPATRNIQVQATFANADGRLRPGMFVETRVVLGASQPVLVLPATAVSYAPYGDSVFVVGDVKGPDGKTYPRRAPAVRQAGRLAAAIRWRCSPASSPARRS